MPGIEPPSIERDGSPRWGDQPRQHAQQCRLATSGGAEDGEARTGLDAEIDAVDDVAPAQRDVQTLDDNLDATARESVGALLISSFDARNLSEAQAERWLERPAPYVRASRPVSPFRGGAWNAGDSPSVKFAWRLASNLTSSAPIATEGTVEESCHLESSGERGKSRLAPRATTSPSAFERHVIEGLGRDERALSSLWFYDDRGSRLFREIMALPSYYPTNAEREILARYSPDIIQRSCTERLLIVDLGAGDASKTRLLLGAASDGGVDATYAPIDVSEGALADAEASLATLMPGQRVTSVVGEYGSGLAELAAREPNTPRLVLMLGSNIGNLEHEAAGQLLASIAAGLGPSDLLLVGYDLMKDPQRLRAAYDDPQGVTAAFNLNLLTRINRELEGDFDLRKFRHVATLDLARPAMESWIVSTTRQTVHVAGRAFELDAWEAIHTEISCKYGDAHFARFARAAGLTEVARFHDERRDFVDVLYRPSGAGRA